MKNVIFATLLITFFSTQHSFAQKFITKTGHVWFFSAAPLENIEAHNHQVNAALDLATGDFVFKVLVNSFEFQKATMQEHFNENYMESDKYPNATFVGKVTNIKTVNLSKPGVYPVTVTGALTIHNVTKQVSVPGTLEVKDGQILGKAKFKILLADYNITIPQTVVNNISKEIEINVDLILNKLNQ